MSLMESVQFETRHGAEAKIELTEWYQRPAIRKIRIPKSYRNKDLDDLLRRKRTKEEAELLHLAKLSNVDCPEVYFVNPSNSEIIMEYIEGTLLKDLPHRSTFWQYGIVGRLVANLHSRGIIHGDLTTKNVIATVERTVLIDFGLSFISDRLEDRAEDLHLLKQGLKSSALLGTALRQFEKVLEGYAKIAGSTETERIRKQMAKIELRGRYAQVD